MTDGVKKWRDFEAADQVGMALERILYCLNSSSKLQNRWLVRYKH